MPETQATAMQLAPAVGYRAAAAGNPAGRATPRRAVELLLGDTGRRPRPPDNSNSGRESPVPP